MAKVIDPAALPVISNAAPGGVDFSNALFRTFRPQIEAFVEAHQPAAQKKPKPKDRPTAVIRKGPWNERPSRSDAGSSAAPGAGKTGQDE